MVFEAFELADTYRMPAMLFADGMLGQMMEPISFLEKQVKPFDKFSWAACGHQGKRKHNVINSLYLKPDELEQTVLERFKRYEIVKEKHTQWEEYLLEDAEYVVVAYGATSRIVRSAINTAREQGIKVGLIRPKTIWPYPTEAISKAADTAKAFLCVEMSMGQMLDDVRLAVNGKAPVAFFGHTGGIVPTPNEVLDEIRKLAGGDR